MVETRWDGQAELPKPPKSGQEMGKDPVPPRRSQGRARLDNLEFHVARDQKIGEQPENDKQGMNCEGSRGGKEFFQF